MSDYSDDFDRAEESNAKLPSFNPVGPKKVGFQKSATLKAPEETFNVNRRDPTVITSEKFEFKEPK